VTLETPDVQLLARPVNLVETQGHDLATAQAIDGHEHEDGPVPDVLFAATVGCGQHLLHFVPAQGCRDPFERIDPGPENGTSQSICTLATAGGLTQNTRIMATMKPTDRRFQPRAW